MSNITMGKAESRFADLIAMMTYRLAPDDPIPVTKITDSKIVRFDDDNHGTTERIARCWFRYTADF